MTLDPKLLDTRITLDWDYISLKVARHRFYKLCQIKWIKSAQLHRSAFKGFHVRITTTKPVPVALFRFHMRDDRRRLLHDLLDKPHDLHDLLWNTKVKNNLKGREDPISTYADGIMMDFHTEPEIKRCIKMFFGRQI